MQQMIATDGATIHYQQQGQGRPLIFLHGWTANAREWLPFAEQLSDQFETICWDARGHFTHPIAQDIDTDIQRMAEDLQQLITTLKLEDVVLIGHSMGALTVWEYIQHYGCDMLGAVCILDQSPKLVTSEDWQHGIYSDFCHKKQNLFQQQLEDDFAEAVLQLVANGHNERSRQNYLNDSKGFQQMRSYLASLSAAPLSRCWQSLTQRDFRPVLSRINVPVLLIYGDESQFYSQTLANWVAAQIPDSELHIYPQADHSPHLWHKERFVSDLRRFCSAH